MASTNNPITTDYCVSFCIKPSSTNKVHFREMVHYILNNVKAGSII